MRGMRGTFSGVHNQDVERQCGNKGKATWDVGERLEVREEVERGAALLSSLGFALPTLRDTAGAKKGQSHPNY